MAWDLTKKKIEELALKYNILPILIGIVLCVTVFFFIMHYLTLSFRETIFNNWFIIISSSIMIICIIINLLLKAKLFVKILLGLAIFIPLGGLYFGIYSVPLNKRYITVTITNFKPVSSNVVDDANNLTYAISDIIGKIQDEKIPIRINKVKYCVDGANQEERRKNAVDLCKSIIGRGNIIIWGDIWKDENQLQIKPYITCANPFNGINFKNANGERIYTSYGPNYLSFKKQVCDSITELLYFVLGVAYFNDNHILEALNLFDKSDIVSKYYYKGLCYDQLADTQKPFTNYSNAIACYDSFIALAGQDDTLWVNAKLNSANAKLSARCYYDRNVYFNMTRSVYNDYVFIADKVKSPLDLFITANNMSVVASDLYSKYNDTNAINTSMKILDSTVNILEKTHFRRYIPYCYFNSGRHWNERMLKNGNQNNVCYNNARAYLKKYEALQDKNDTLMNSAYYSNIADLFIHFSTTLIDKSKRKIYLDSANIQLKQASKLNCKEVRESIKLSYIVLLAEYSNIENDNDKRLKLLTEAIDTVDASLKILNRYNDGLDWAYLYFLKAGLLYSACYRINNDTLTLYYSPIAINIGLSAIDSAKSVYTEYKAVSNLNDITKLREKYIAVRSNFKNKKD
ncbi:hypothetical protein HZA73_01350 [candidate division TA06 bacterium]|nr:hypothetical protein [candidate division TA06 bacterium]